MDVDGTMTDGGVILLSQTEEIALEIRPLTRPMVRASHSRTLPAFALAALPDAKARLYFGALAK